MKALLARGVPENRIRHKSVPFDLVPRYLNAADAGVLLRGDFFGSHIASPVKTAEYLAMGMPILISGGIGDLSGRVLEKNIGAVVGSMDEKGFLTALAEIDNIWG